MTPPARTRIEAIIDVGFGNHLHIRGQGPGLNWDQGTPMQCVDGVKWVWTSPGANQAIAFKVLLNDQVWAHGDNAMASPGQTLQITPVF